MPIFSKRELEGYLLIDHSDSPGLTEAEAKRGARTSLLPFVGAGQKLETPTQSCSHCERIVIINPKRTRHREWCRSCDHYICDVCGFEAREPGYVHKSYKQKMEDHLNFVIRTGVLNGA
jgi:hypothetical protein